jgi:hypothetical protein
MHNNYEFMLTGLYNPYTDGITGAKLDGINTGYHAGLVRPSEQTRQNGDKNAT